MAAIQAMDQIVAKEFQRLARMGLWYAQMHMTKNGNSTSGNCDVSDKWLVCR